MTALPAPVCHLHGVSHRRRLLGLATLGLFCAACRGCPVGFGIETGGTASRASVAYLQSVLPKVAPPLPTATGAQPLGLGVGRDGVVYLPSGLTGPAPLLVLLHGANGSAAGITSRTDAFAQADELKMVIVAIDSRGRTWDAIRGDFGPDLAFLDKALEKVFALVGEQRGARPVFYVSHGRRDEILPFDGTGSRIVPALEGAGYSVRFEAFDGPHTIPAVVAREAFQWIAGKKS